MSVDTRLAEVRIPPALVEDGTARRCRRRVAVVSASPTSPRAPRFTRWRTACCGRRRPRASSPRTIAAGDAGRRASGCSAATCCWRSTTSRSRRCPTSLRRLQRGEAGADPPLHGSAARARARWSTCGSPRFRAAPGALYFLLAARRHLHAARRRRRAPAAPARSGDAALLLAVGRLLRRVHLLVQRPARSARLDLLLGRRDGDLLLPPLFLHFTLVFPERAAAVDWRRRSVARSSCRSLYVPARCSASRAVIAGVARRRERADVHPRRSQRSIGWSSLYLAVCFIGGLAASSARWREVRTVTARRQLRWIAWGTALGAAPFALGYALPYAARRRAVAADAAVGHSARA